MKLVDLMAKASYMKEKNPQELAEEELKINMEIERNPGVKSTKGEEHKFGTTSMSKQEDLGHKLSEKMQFPQ